MKLGIAMLVVGLALVGLGLGIWSYYDSEITTGTGAQYYPPFNRLIN